MKLYTEDATARELERLYGPFTYDICDVCRKPLREALRVDVVQGGFEFSREYDAHGAIIISYCKEHAP
jgi:hypothetical protein